MNDNRLRTKTDNMCNNCNSMQITSIKRVCCTSAINMRTALFTEDEGTKPVLPRGGYGVVEGDNRAGGSGNGGGGQPRRPHY